MKKPPREPTRSQEFAAIIADGCGIKRPPGAKTVREWRREVCLHWFGRMVDLMSQDRR